MAWIKMRTDLRDDPRVIFISRQLKKDRNQVIGMLYCLWSWTDTYTKTGDCLPVLDEDIEKISGGRSAKGFAAALRKVGWLAGDNWELRLPNYDEHNGETAKSRALTSKRMARIRDGRSVTESEQVRHLEKEKEKDKKKDSTLWEKRAPVRPTGSELPRTPSMASAAPTLAERGEGWKGGARVQANSPLMIRINAWFRRKPTTLWTLEEDEAMKANGKLDADELDLLEAFYAEKIPSNNDYRRKTVKTLMANFNAEVDRARRYMEKKAQNEEETGADEGF